MPDNAENPFPFEPTKPTPEMIQWARENFNEAEALAGIQEIFAGGGQQLHEFIDELKAIAASKEQD